MCGQGQYYGQISARNHYCKRYYQKAWGCKRCPGNKVKTDSGNLQSLCVDACDGKKNVPKGDRTGCGKWAKTKNMFTHQWRIKGARATRTPVKFVSFYAIFGNFSTPSKLPPSPRRKILDPPLLSKS